MEALIHTVESLFGLTEDPSHYGYGQMSARAVFVYAMAFLLVRIGKNRFLGKSSTFDIVFGFIFGSMLSRGINGAGPLFPTLFAGGVMLLVHWGVGWLAVRSDTADETLNGSSATIVKDGEIDEAAQRHAQISDKELKGQLRLQGSTDVSKLAEVRVERNGAFSVVPMRGETKCHTVDLGVEEGVKKVRVVLELPG